MNHPDDMILMQISCHRTNSEVIDMIFTHTYIHACTHPYHTYIHTYITLHYNITLYCIVLHYATLYYIIQDSTTLFSRYSTLAHYIYMHDHIYFGHGMTFGPVKSGLHHNFSFVLSLNFQTVTIFAVYETIYIASIDVVGISTT